MVHPGCGKKSRSKGYNSVGTYCDGWAGNCGEGGKGASSWYLMCENCREKYMERNRNENLNALPSTGGFLSNPKISTISVVSKQNGELNSDLYTMIKENALFLLELSSTTTSKNITQNYLMINKL